jgi:hypothetical protein
MTKLLVVVIVAVALVVVLRMFGVLPNAPLVVH